MVIPIIIIRNPCALTVHSMHLEPAGRICEPCCYRLRYFIIFFDKAPDALHSLERNNILTKCAEYHGIHIHQWGLQLPRGCQWGTHLMHNNIVGL
jgi:hypothetical protein